MNLETITYTQKKFNHHSQFLTSYIQSRKQELEILHEFFGILHIKDKNYSAAEEFAAITRPETRYEKAPVNPRYCLATDDGEFELDISEVERCLEGQILAVEGKLENRILSGSLIQYNEIIEVKEIPESRAKGVLLFSDIRGDLGRLALYAAMPRIDIEQTIIGGCTFPDLLETNLEKIMSGFEYSPMDEYFSMATDFYKVDSILRRFNNTTLMTGFTDPASIEFPQPPMAKICLPDSYNTIKCVGNPSVAENGSHKVVFINYGTEQDLEEILRAGHIFPEVGFHVPAEEMESDCFCVSFDVLVAFGETCNSVKRYVLRNITGKETNVIVIGVSRVKGMIIDFSEGFSWAEVNI